ncbi:hydroxymyristoyl-ACP dehydratase [Gillisia sp. M10.2A]|uniref:Hydroxymyristoyl-ACP dehydratase n=1 Tax=Gillisia lutea TaxID=2909668 RepID=A0ABS9EFE0_9FLAO|nr:hydroxymyristoyl-ACP dehydratase [Gillisia lutea]MCF4101588.1 hydroxymyristoyl-ACP dehydratase [Gillisia lutea]
MLDYGIDHPGKWGRTFKIIFVNFQEILSRLPYSEPFLFVDSIEYLDENSVIGHYCFPEKAYYYKGHFKNKPITPGVLLTECMAQIGVVCLGINLLGIKNDETPAIAMTSTEIDFFLAVQPGETVKVVSHKLYFRFNKLKCKVEMYNRDENLIARGNISGMLKDN